MAYNHENIIVGAADIYLGDDAGQALPDFTVGTSARAAFDGAATGWTHVGLTTGGVEFAYAPDFGEVEVDQYLDVAKMFKQRQTVTVNTTFAEATLENLLFAWGQPGRTWSEDTDYIGDAPAEGDEELIIHGGALGDKPVERSLAFVGQAPGEGRERVYYLGRVLSVESSSHSLSRSEATTIPVSLRCLPSGGGDTSGEVEYGRIIERATTGAVTP